MFATVLPMNGTERCGEQKWGMVKIKIKKKKKERCVATIDGIDRRKETTLIESVTPLRDHDWRQLFEWDPIRRSMAPIMATDRSLHFTHSFIWFIHLFIHLCIKIFPVNVVLCSDI